MIVEIDQLYRIFGKTTALAGVSFSIENGEVVGLLGPNGAGKTTCLRILTGFLPPSRGRVHIDGIDVQRDGLRAREQIGYLAEGAASYPEMRVDAYLRFRARLRGLRGRAQREAIDTVVERCHLTDVRRRLIGQLSRGYRQRTGLAAAMLGAPKLLVLDEPTAGLDPNQIAETEALLREVASEQTTVLLSSHILAQVEAVCSRLLVLNRGELVADGTVEQVRAAGSRRAVEATIRGPIEAVTAALTELSGVAEVSTEPAEPADDEVVRCRIEGENTAALREAIAAAVRQQGWGLQELTSADAPLDEVFRRLTTPTGSDSRDEDRR